MKHARIIVVSGALALLSSSTSALGEGPQRRNSSLNPEFKGVSEREGFFVGVLKDGTVSVNLTEISFGGVTSLSDILTDQDDSHNTLSLAEIEEIKILEPVYQSPRHTKNPDDTFFIKALVTVHKKNGSSSSSEFLFPSNITISGKERDTNIKKAWRLKDINTLSIKKAEPLSVKKELEKMDPKNSQSTTAQAPVAPKPLPVVHDPLWKIILKPLIWLWHFLEKIAGSLLAFLK